MKIYYHEIDKELEIELLQHWFDGYEHEIDYLILNHDEKLLTKDQIDDIDKLVISESMESSYQDF